MNIDEVDPRLNAVTVAYDFAVRRNTTSEHDARRSIVNASDDLHFREYLDTAEQLGFDVSPGGPWFGQLEAAFKRYRQQLNAELMGEA